MGYILTFALMGLIGMSVLGLFKVMGLLDNLKEI
jgi:hypothetical protein